MNLLLIKKTRNTERLIFVRNSPDISDGIFFIYEKTPTFVRNLPDISDGLLGKDRYG
jgi:hypothetical protein